MCLQVFCGRCYCLKMWLSLYVLVSFSKCPIACPVCLNPLSSPVRLPCRHVICDTCVYEVDLCPKEGCDGEIPEGFIYNPADDRFEQVILDLNTFINLQVRWLSICCCMRDQIDESHKHYHFTLITVTKMKIMSSTTNQDS